MVRKKVYLETSVISYLTARSSRDILKLAKQEITREWWCTSRSYFDLHVSIAVLDEIRKGDPEAAKRRLNAVAGLPVLETGSDDAVDVLLERLLSSGAVPVVALLDAYHIAVSAVNGMAFLLTWNCKHINNAERKHKIATVVADAGYSEVVIATPEELWR